MLDAHSTMNEIVSGIIRADPGACYEFARRQTRTNLAALATGAAIVRDVAFQLECAQPHELMVWKFPDEYEPVPGRIFPEAIDAAAEGDTDAVFHQLQDLAFCHLATTASAAYHLQQSVEYLLANDSARNTPDPQGRLF